MIDDASPPGSWKRAIEQRPAASTKPGLKERAVQRQIIQLCAAFGVVCVHVGNGIPLPGDPVQRAKIINAMKKDGLRPGFPDLILIGRKAGQIGFIETKREKGGRLDPDQVWWRDELLAAGHPWALARGTDDVIAALREWGWRP